MEGGDPESALVGATILVAVNDLCLELEEGWWWDCGDRWYILCGCETD